MEMCRGEEAEVVVVAMAMVAVARERPVAEWVGEEGEEAVCEW